MKKVSGLKITELVLGEGALAERGKVATIKYHVSLNHGEPLPNPANDGQPFTFLIGNRDIIAGLWMGVVGMKVGGKRKVKVSPHLAYGDKSVPGVPANAVLVYEIDLIDIQE